MAPVAATADRRWRRPGNGRGAELMEQFAEGDRVRVLAHDAHALPAALEGCYGWVGNIAKVKGDDLYDVRLDDADPVPTVQLHAEQLERRVLS